ncbi:hypothetical protein, variant [Verruconis gallopava]|nr:hypothetical protein, variant [Verruconis gallopava]KIW01357.1 hypothetical protein, variant [Verruconis gallopava]
MLDRDDPSQFHYYQPGIGTYVQSGSLSHSSKFERLKSTYLKAKDSAIGTSFDEHVMGGYKFLMRYYNVGDDIFLFGFSRGAYTARFLAEMLDHVGLLSAGNEEMARFAWKAFQRWQQRTEATEKERQQKKFLMNYMCAFRETFSRPVRRIRFLGLFDTVNSVPQFENAWLQRSKFPYTARSTAKVIRHAVAIDERRAKFRQDLIGELRPHKKQNHYRRRHQKWDMKHDDEEVAPDEVAPRGRKPSDEHQNHLGPPTIVPPRFRDQSETSGLRSLSPSINDDVDRQSAITDLSQDSLKILHHRHSDFADADSDDDEQDIQEVWFAGAHADIGGGWPLSPGEDTALSHIPLVWMVREAEKAGLRFDPKKLRDLNCAEDVFRTRRKSMVIPQIEIETPGQDDSSGKTTEYTCPEGGPKPPIANVNEHAVKLEVTKEQGQAMPTVGLAPQNEPDLTAEAENARASRFLSALKSAAIKGRIHDVLQFNNGCSALQVIAWNFMEYLPFRRMDLQPDGSWKSINWPLPKGEVRDVPDNVVIHHSVIQRMKADPTYRPGNLIIGGGGRGVRFAPPEYGIGNWRLLREEGDPVGECWVRDGPPGLNMNGVHGPLRRPSFRDRSVLLDELLRDLEDIVRLFFNVISLIMDFFSRRMARQDKM